MAKSKYEKLMKNKVQRSKAKASPKGSKHNPKSQENPRQSIAVYIVIAIIIGASIYGAGLAINNSSTTNIDGGMTNDFVPVEYDESGDSGQIDQGSSANGDYNTQLSFTTIDGI